MASTDRIGLFVCWIRTYRRDHHIQLFEPDISEEYHDKDKMFLVHLHNLQTSLITSTVLLSDCK